MNVPIKVFPQAKKNCVKEEAGILKVYTTAAAVEGKANKATIVLLSKYYKIKKSQVEIIKGLRTKQKVIRIEG